MLLLKTTLPPEEAAHLDVGIGGAHQCQAYVDQEDGPFTGSTFGILAAGVVFGEVLNCIRLNWENLTGQGSEGTSYSSRRAGLKAQSQPVSR